MTYHHPYLFKITPQNPLGQSLANPLGDRHKFHSHRRLSILPDDWLAAVASFTSGDVDRDLAEKRDPEALRFAFAPTAAEDVVSLVIRRRNEIAHVFNQSEHGNIDLLKHGGGLARIDQRHFLWRRDNDGPGKRDGLNDRQLNVAGPWRQIEHQKIKLAPIDLT